MKTSSALLVASVILSGSVSPASAAPGALDKAMNGFLKAIHTKNTKLFLSYISPSKGLHWVNTLGGGTYEPRTFSYASLEKDFAAKKGLYSNFFTVWTEDSSFFDAVTHIKGGKWKKVNSNTFIPAARPWGNENTDQYPLKWQKINGKWFLIELGWPES